MKMPICLLGLFEVRPAIQSSFQAIIRYCFSIVGDISAQRDPSGSSSTYFHWAE